MIAVADGVSAGRKSEDASALAIDILYKRVAPLLSDTDAGPDEINRTLLAAARAANHEIAQRPRQSLSSADATTLVAACVLGRHGVAVWCGDSRLYRLTAHRAERLTRDHSWLEQVVHHGLMSAEDAARDPRAHMITRWLGPQEQEDLGIESVRFELEDDDVAMCCTDGLYNYFAAASGSDETEMSRVLFGGDHDLQAGVEALVRIALDRGGRDDITAAAIRLAPPDHRRPPH